MKWDITYYRLFVDEDGGLRKNLKT
jgi:hypothetical protein